MKSLHLERAVPVAFGVMLSVAVAGGLWLARTRRGVALRFWFFYGPGTWYNPDGAAADQARKQELAVIGAGEGVWSWVHIEDAAVATVAAMTAPPGVYHVVDDDPSPVSVWLPAFARWVGAPPTPRVTELKGRERGGEDAVYYGTKLRGASNAKAKATLSFGPRRLHRPGQCKDRRGCTLAAVAELGRSANGRKVT